MATSWQFKILAFTLTNLFLDLRKLKSLYLEGNYLEGNFSIDLALVI